MAFSYSGIIGYGKATNPSVSGWLTNNNIVRDPPRSYQTKRKDKVLENNDILKMVDASGSRVCEAILPYARGVNPMVSVSYQNTGSTMKGVGNSATNASSLGSAQAYNPYTVARNGAFRPPILRQEDLLPLSRLPRNATSMCTWKANPNYAQRVKCQGTAKDYREVKNTLLKASTANTKYYPKETPMVMSGEMAIRDTILHPEERFACKSQKRSNDIQKMDAVPFIQYGAQGKATAQKSSNNRVLAMTTPEKQQEKFIQSTLLYDHTTNLAKQGGKGYNDNVSYNHVAPSRQHYSRDNEGVKPMLQRRDIPNSVSKINSNTLNRVARNLASIRV